MDFYKKLAEIIGEDRVFTAEPMCLHTTFKIGGPADFFVKTTSEEELRQLIYLCNEYNMPRFILGNGSNLLVSDLGYRGVVIQLWKPKEAIQCSRTDNSKFVSVRIAAGTLLSQAAMAIAEKGLSGFAYAGGIPGTVGGAVIMNAGAYEGEIKDHLVSSRVMNEDGTIVELSNEALKFGYRSSALQGTTKIVLDASFRFPKGEPKEILAEMEELNRRRREKQPLSYPSAGSTFRRPQGSFAGKLIMDAGLCGYRINDAQVSEKHCGFLINRGNATASDMLQLINEVSAKVEEQFGVKLVPEVRMLGEF